MIIGQGRYLKDSCSVCGHLLLVNGKCERKCKPRREKIGDYSGKSKSEFAFGKY